MLGVGNAIEPRQSEAAQARGPDQPQALFFRRAGLAVISRPTVAARSSRFPISGDFVALRSVHMNRGSLLLRLDGFCG